MPKLPSPTIRWSFAAAAMLTLLGTPRPALAAPPLPPAIVSASGKTGQVSLTWKDCTGCVKYNVKRSLTSGGPWTTVASNLTDNAAVIPGSNGTTYYFVITGKNVLAQESANSPQVNATPLAVPLGMTATGDSTQVKLQWNTGTLGATGYRIERGTAAAGPFALLGTTASTSFNDTTVTQGTPYFYRVAATRGGNNQSNFTAVVTGTALPKLPPPTHVAAHGGVALAALSWTAPAGTASIQVEQSPDGASGWITVPCSSTGAGSCHVEGLITGEKYFFRLRAINANGLASNPSAVVGAAIPMADWHPADPGSIRIMNVPVQCRLADGYSSFDDEASYDMTFDTRMERVMEIIRKEDPDVIAVQQVEAALCYTSLFNSLTDTWPSALKLGALMIFSKHPFVEYPAPVQETVPDKIMVNGGWVNPPGNLLATAVHSTQIDSTRDDHRSFYSFMVRIQPPGGHAVNVVVTDLVSVEESDEWYGPDCLQWEHQQGRRVQMADIEAMIKGTLTDEERAQEPVFLVGILDVDGNRAPDHERISWDLEGPPDPLPEPGKACRIEDGYYIGESVVENANFDGEWERVFDNSVELETRFWTKGVDCFLPACLEDSLAFFTDSWGFEHPSAGAVADWGQNYFGEVLGDYDADTDFYLGQTTVEAWHPLAGQGGRRTDYILHNQPRDADFGEYLAASHLRRVFFYDPDGPGAQTYQPEDYLSLADDSVTHPFHDNHPVSNHYFTVGDFFFSRTPRSNPLPNDGVTGPEFGAEVVQFSQQDMRYEDITLTDRRHYAWFFLPDVEGTVTIGSNLPEQVRVDVYHPSDLSTAIPPYHQLVNCYDADGICGQVMDLPDPPYFVRYSLAPGVEPPLTFAAGFHLHRCSDPVKDFCVLPNGEERSVRWPDDAPNEPYSGTPAHADQMYFLAAVDSVAGNAPVRFRVETENEDQFQLGLTGPGEGGRLFGCGLDADIPDCPASGSCNTPLGNVGSWTAWDDDDEDSAADAVLDTGNEQSGALSPATPGTPRTVLLRIHRQCTGTACDNSLTSVTFRSQQYRIVPELLRVLVENDYGMNDDEVYMSVALDAGSAPGLASCENDPPPGERLPYMDPTSSSEDGETAPTFTTDFGDYEDDAGLTTWSERVYVTFCEEDNGSDTNDLLGEVAVDEDVALNVQHQKNMVQGDSDDPISHYRFVYSVVGEASMAPLEACP
jgi:hypothetical protein